MKNNRQNGDALSSWISEKASKKNRASQKGASFFYWVMFALPLLQFVIFYLVVNFNSILLAFQQIVPEKIGGVTHYVSSFVGFGTIKKFLTVELVSESYLIAIKNSLVYFVFSIAVIIPCGLIFSYYIYKKYPLAETYRTFLFLPSVICVLILVIFYQYLVDFSIPELIQKITGKRPRGFLTNGDTAFVTLVIFNFFFSFGPSTLVYLNAMTQIDPSVIEAAELDGAVGIRQFWQVVLPLVFPSITSYIIISIAHVAVNQLAGHSFFGVGAGDYKVQTIGYNLFVKVLGSNAELNYPTAAAGGIFFTLIIAPLTLVTRWLFEKFGPSED